MNNVVNKRLLGHKLLDFTFIYLLLIIPLFEPQSFRSLSIHNYYRYFLIVSIILIFLIYFIQVHMSRFMLSIICFFSIFTISDIINRTSMQAHLVLSIKAIAICMLFEISLLHSYKSWIKAMRLFLFVCCLLQFYTRIINPDGFFSGAAYINIPVYFMDNKNSVMPYFYLLFIVTILDFVSRKRKKMTFVFGAFVTIVLIVISTVESWSSTGIVVVFILLLSLAVVLLSKKVKINITLSGVSIVYAIFFFSIIIFRLQDSFSLVIEGVLHKSLTFTGRTYIWNQAINVFTTSPLYGIGTGYGGNGVALPLHYGNVIIWNSYGAHDQFLQYAVDGGLIAIAFLICVFIVTCVHTRKFHDSHDLLVSFLSLSIFAIMIGMSMELYENGWLLFLVLCILYHRNQLCLNNNVVIVDGKNLLDSHAYPGNKI